MRTASNRRLQTCSYVVVLEPTNSDLGPLCEYLAELAVEGCEVIVLDRSAAGQFAENTNRLRWVSRHMPISPAADALLVIAEQSGCDKVIVADESVRYEPADLARVCVLLDFHEVVEPHDFIDPLPWWNGIDAAHALLHRGLDSSVGHSSTFAFRRTAICPLRRAAGEESEHPVRRLAVLGASVFGAADLFIRRSPRRLVDWMQSRPAVAELDLSVPIRSIFFFGLLPTIIILGLLFGPVAAAGFVLALALVAIGVAIRGRIGAGMFFPRIACFLAPFWLVERSISIYFALFRRLRGVAFEPAGALIQPISGKKAASGE